VMFGQQVFKRCGCCGMTPAKRPETATTPKVPTARPPHPFPLLSPAHPQPHVATWGSLAGASTVLTAFQPARFIASYGCSAVLPRLTISGSMPSRFGKQSHVGPDSQRPSEEVGGERSKPRTPSTPETPRLTRCRGPRTSDFTPFSAATADVEGKMSQDTHTSPYRQYCGVVARCGVCCIDDFRVYGVAVIDQEPITATKGRF